MALGKKTGGRVAATHCTKCGKDLDLDPCYNGYQRRARCKTCVNDYYRGRFTEYSREYHKRPEAKARKRELALIKNYKLTPNEYKELLEFQQGGCAICRKSCATGRDLAVDHNHQTGAVRGLLCIKCNVALGSLNEDEDLIWKVLEYLKRHDKTVAI
jgi:hypothetical protein